MRVLRRANKLRGYHLRALDGDIGKIKECYFDDTNWAVRYFVVDTGNWLLGRRVLIAPVALNGVDETEKVVHTNLNREQVENSPPVETEKPVSRQYEEEYYQHYGWMPYWDSGPFLGSGLPPAPVIPTTSDEEIEKKNKEETHLRSTSEVIGYSIEATDGDLGHVADFIIEDQEWTVQYLEVDTRNWWPGKKVLISSAWINQISWLDRKVVVDLSREKIQSAPPYDPWKVISKDYELQLYEYYGQRKK